jgi:hypothetical protein
VPEPITISDHALVRYLEWEGFVDLSAVRAMLGAHLLRATNAAATIDAESYSIIADGLIYLVRNGTLVTITEETPSSRVWAQRRQDAG